MSKRFSFIFVSIMVFCAVFLSACSNNNGSASADGKTTIKVWAMGDEGKKLPALVKEFEKKNPKIKVDVQAIPWDTAHDKLLTAVASGNGPDVMEVGTTWIPEFAAAGAFKDLSSYVSKYPNLKKDNYFEGATATMTHDGKLISVPWYVDTRVLFYRTDLLKSVGYDKAPTTWAEVKDASKKLAAKGKNHYGISLDQNDQFTPFMFAWANGWKFNFKNGKANFMDPKFVNAMKVYHSFFKEGLAPKSKGLDGLQGFKKGTLPMFVSGPWMVNSINSQLPDLKGKWAISTLPKIKDNPSMVGGADFTIFKSSKHVDQDLKFMSFLTDPQTQVKWYKMSNDLPSQKSAWDNAEIKNNKYLKTFKEQLQNTNAEPQVVKFEDVAQDLLHTLEQVNVGNANLKQSLKDFSQKANQTLQQANQ